MGQFSFWLLIPLVFGLIVLFVAWRVLARGFFKKQVGRFFSILMTDDYPESLLELYSAFTRAGGPIPVFELNLRSEQGKVIERPLGSPQAVPNLSKLRFDVAQVHILPTEGTTPVETSVVIGPKAEKPLYLSTPIMVGGMAYGIALSEKARIALAKGSALAGTSITSGSGPFLQAERDNAKYWILQYSRAFWAKEDQVISQANAIEIALGQGSFAGLSHKTPAKDIDATLQKAFPIQPGQEAVILARHAGVNKPEDFKTLITSLRARAGGIPIGVKMACSKDLELDLEIIAEAGVDFINISGSQGATYGSPPSIGDSFGLPTLFALVRAGQFFEKHGLKGKISLITGGGFTEPGEMLKALALGADAVEIGSAALFAISHTEVLKALPFEPPTQIVWYTGKYKHKYDEQKGAQYLANYIKACTDEMAEGVRAMGKTSLHQVSKVDLFAMDRKTAEIVGVPLGYVPSTLQSPKNPATAEEKTTPHELKTLTNRHPRVKNRLTSARKSPSPPKYKYYPMHPRP